MTDKPKNMKDECQTPGYGLEPLLSVINYIRVGAPISSVWEPAAGEGLLADEIHKHFFMTTRTCISTGKDFLTYNPKHVFDAIITNPPFSLKHEFVERCCEHNKPWALLMESNTVSTKWFINIAKVLKPEIGIIWFSPRINFKMPYKKWEGGGSHFPTAWFTWKMGFSGNKYVRMDHWTKEYREQYEV